MGVGELNYFILEWKLIVVFGILMEVEWNFN